MTVEFTGEIITVSAVEYPFFSAALHRKLSEVRAFPCSLQRQRLRPLPVLQISGTQNREIILPKIKHHIIGVAFLMPVYLGISVLLRKLPDRSSLHPLQRLSSIRTDGDPLGEGLSPAPLRLASRTGIKINLRIAIKPQHPPLIHNAASGINGSVPIRIQNGLLPFPMQQITAHRVAPAHIFPSGIKGIVLIKQMINPILIQQTIGIVDPSRIRREMNQRMGLTDLRNAVGKGNGV